MYVEREQEFLKSLAFLYSGFKQNSSQNNTYNINQKPYLTVDLTIYLHDLSAEACKQAKIVRRTPMTRYKTNEWTQRDIHASYT